MSNSQPEVLTRYFMHLDARRSSALVQMFAPDGVMITRGGTGGEPVRGHDALRQFFLDRPPPTSRHVITSGAQGPDVCLAEGLVKPLVAGETKFFIASATLDDAGLITRYTTLVWTELTGIQERELVPVS